MVNPWIALRHALSVVVGILFCTLLSGCGGGSSTGNPAAAFQYGYSMVETMRLCDLIPAVNQFEFQSELTTAQDHSVISPNNDTLYGKACAYLGASWVLVTMPPANGRYMSMQVFDAYQNTVAVRGPKEIPPSGAQYVLHLSGTSSAGMPAGVPVIEVPTPFAYVFTRTLVNGAADLDAAKTAQNLINITANSAVTPVPTPSFVGATVAQDFFQKLMFRLAQNPPPAAEAKMVAGYAEAGIRPSLTPSLAGVTSDQLKGWENAYTAGMATLDANAGITGSRRDTWGIVDPKFNGIFGADYLLRAVVTKFYVWRLPSADAFLMGTTTAISSTSLDGRTAHTLTLPGGAWPPIDPRGFWSLTIYGLDKFLVANPINRYSISHRTQGVQIESDGSMKIYLQCTSPGAALESNWLPAPCGPYSIALRLFMPTTDVLSPSFTLPAIQ